MIRFLGGPKGGTSLFEVSPGTSDGDAMTQTAESFLESLNPFGIELGLGRMRALLAALKDPQKSLRCIQVAGTNGKGSASATLDAILRTAGHSCGLYTSPHLVHIEERIRVGGKVVSHEAFEKSILAVRDAMNESGLHATYFEVLTAAALHRFFTEGVEFAVLEVGLGGRLDATSAVVPEAEIITRIGMDHMAILGASLEKIAAEKAAIIRPKTKAFVSRQPQGALSVISDRAEAVQAHISLAGRDFGLTYEGETAQNGSPRDGFIRGTNAFLGEAVRPSEFSFFSKEDGFSASHLDLALEGAHQLDNAEVAVAAARHISSKVNESTLRVALGAVHWPGRFQRVSTTPDTYVDGAHNLDGARVLASLIDEKTGTKRASFQRPAPHLVFSALGDKDVFAVATWLFPRAEKIHLVPLENNPRALSLDELSSLSRRFKIRCQLHRTIEEALEVARREALQESGESGWVVASGSLFLVGEVLRMSSLR